MLEATAQPATADEVAERTGLALFRVRSGLRELVGAGLVTQQGERFVASSAQSL